MYERNVRSFESFVRSIANLLFSSLVKSRSLSFVSILFCINQDSKTAAKVIPAVVRRNQAYETAAQGSSVFRKTLKKNRKLVGCISLFEWFRGISSKWCDENIRKFREKSKGGVGGVNDSPTPCYYSIGFFPKNLYPAKERAKTKRNIPVWIGLNQAIAKKENIESPSAIPGNQG